jgi:pimeloyl-ACP methyl ester carboxylesterase
MRRLVGGLAEEGRCGRRIVPPVDRKRSELAKLKTRYSKDFVVSTDGTRIGYRQLGHGPGLILVHGGMKSSQDLMTLAALLAAAFTVYVPDRRGRGLSGAYGDSFCIAREVEDLQALITKTGSRQVFGLSGGGLVVLRTALVTPGIQRAALYEPPLSTDGSAPTSWVPRYEQEVAHGKWAAAAVTAVKGIGTEPTFNRLPRVLLVPLMTLIMKLQGTSTGDDVTIRALIPTMHFEMRNVRELSDSLDDYRSLRIPILLMGGGRSPRFFWTILESLKATLPAATLKSFPELGHNGPEDDGRPQLIAKELADYFRRPSA